MPRPQCLSLRPGPHCTEAGNSAPTIIRVHTTSTSLKTALATKRDLRRRAHCPNLKTTTVSRSDLLFSSAKSAATTSLRFMARRYHGPRHVRVAGVRARSIASHAKPGAWRAKQMLRQPLRSRELKSKCLGRSLDGGARFPADGITDAQVVEVDHAVWLQCRIAICQAADGEGGAVKHTRGRERASLPETSTGFESQPRLARQIMGKRGVSGGR